MSKRLPIRAGGVAVALLAVLAAACFKSAPPSRGGPRPRIASLVPSATETLFAIGAGNLVVARSRYGDMPPAARALPIAGDATTANTERILALRADVVLVGSAAQEASLAPIEGRVQVETVVTESITDLRELIRLLGGITHHEKEGRELLDRIDKALRQARARYETGTGPRVLFSVQHDPLVVAGRGSYVGELLTAIGAVNVAGDLARPWPELSLESLVARNPEVILDASFAPGKSPGSAELSFWDRFATVKAVRDHRVVPVREEALLRPGPRLPEAVKTLERLVYGKAR